MPELALRPRSATELVDAAFQVYRRAPVQFMVALGVVYVPWLVIRLMLDINIDPTNPTLPDASTLLAIAVGGIAIYAIAGGVITLLARDVYLDQPVNVPEAFRVVATRLLTLVVASLLWVVLLAIGTFLFVLPALYVASRFISIRQAIVLEDAGVGRAFSRSSALSSGLKLHILGTLILVGLLIIAVNVGAGWMISLIPSRVLVNVLTTVLSVVVGPLLGITEAVLYYDLRIRREGFDLEYLVGKEPASSTAPPNVPL